MGLLLGWLFDYTDGLFAPVLVHGLYDVAALLAVRAGALGTPGAVPAEEVAIDWSTVVLNMLTIKGIYGREMYETWYKMTVMIQSGLDVDPVITHRLDYAQFEEGFQAMRSGNSGKVILTWRREAQGQ